jgi:hypothetical protein
MDMLTELYLYGRVNLVLDMRNARPAFEPRSGGCPCECNSGGFCGGCGHAGCGGRR